MTGLSLRDRIGVDLGRRIALEDGIDWAGRNGVSYVDAQTDISPNALESFDDARCARIRAACEEHGLHLGLHTLSAVNIAEISPFLRDAVDDYLKAYMDLSKKLGAEWIVVHGGYHFTADKTLRTQASLDRLMRACDYAGEVGAVLLLENLNGEPEHAEVNYMPHALDECQEFFAKLTSPNLRWSFTINHAHFEPEKISGFIDGMDMNRCQEVRIADNNGEYEIHMQPGTGTVDFGEMFQKIESAGFTGHYMNGFGTIEDMLEGRDYLVERAREAGVDVGERSSQG